MVRCILAAMAHARQRKRSGNEDGTQSAAPWSASPRFGLLHLAFADHTAFVGDLSPEVDDALLESTFKTYYPSVRHAKVRRLPSSFFLREQAAVRTALHWG